MYFFLKLCSTGTAHIDPKVRDVCSGGHKMGGFMKNLKFVVMALGVLSMTATYTHASGLADRQVITLDLANKMIAACAAYAEDKGLDPLTIAVFDDGGNLKALNRQDGALMVTLDFAQGKARTAAMLGMSTKDLGDSVEFADNDRPMGLRYLDGISMVQGGLPIRSKSGQLLGGIGVSGAPSEQDEACGWAALDAVSDYLQ